MHGSVQARESSCMSEAIKELPERRRRRITYISAYQNSQNQCAAILRINSNKNKIVETTSRISNTLSP